MVVLARDVLGSADRPRSARARPRTRGPGARRSPTATRRATSWRRRTSSCRVSSTRRRSLGCSRPTASCSCERWSRIRGRTGTGSRSRSSRPRATFASSISSGVSRYASFLGKELRAFWNCRGRLLVVMPNGYGIYHDGRSVAREEKILEKTPAPNGPLDIARASQGPVLQLAADRGVKLTLPPLPASTEPQ
jgi:hypothetical protein